MMEQILEEEDEDGEGTMASVVEEQQESADSSQAATRSTPIRHIDSQAMAFANKGDNRRREELLRRKAELMRKKEEKLMRELEEACEKEREDAKRLEMHMKQKQEKEEVERKRSVAARYKPDPYRLVVLSDDSEEVRMRREAIKRIRKEAEKGKPIIHKSMGDLQRLCDIIHRYWNPYEKRIPKVRHFVEFGMSLRDAYRLYESDLSTWVDFLKLEPTRDNMTRANQWLDIPFLVQRYQVTGSMLHRDCMFKVDDFIAQKLTVHEMVQLRINVQSLLDMGMKKRHFLLFTFSLMQDWILSLDLTASHLTEHLDINPFDYNYLVKERMWDMNIVNRHLGLQDAVAIERPLIVSHATPIVYSDDDFQRQRPTSAFSRPLPTSSIPSLSSMNLSPQPPPSVSVDPVWQQRQEQLERMSVVRVLSPQEYREQQQNLPLSARSATRMVSSIPSVQASVPSTPPVVHPYMGMIEAARTSAVPVRSTLPVVHAADILL